LGEPIGSISNYFGDSVSIAREAAQNHRSRGTFSYDTGYALFLILLIPFTLDLQKNDSIILKRFKNITLLVSIFALTFSFTRSCWLSFFITQSFIIIKNLKSKKKIFNLFILGIIAIPIAIFGGLAELIELRLFGDDSLNSSESRSVILASGLNVFFDNIYFGSGWSGFLSPDYFPSKDEVHIHNIFLLALIEFGLCGLFILIYIVKKLLFESRKYMNGRIKPEYISVVGGLIANLLDWSIMSPVSGAIFWALCGLLFNTSISKWENEIKKNNSHQKSDISAPLLLK
jgi:O-antigen ligase